MKKPNTLLKVVSILYIIFSILSGIIVILGSLGIGSLLGSAAGDVAAGLAMTMFFAAISLVGVVLGLMAGINGIKAQNLKLCKTLGIILIVFAVLSAIGSILNKGGIVSALIGLVLPILYTIGVSKEING